LLALIWIVSPVAGFRPALAALWLTEKVPNPTSAQEPPLASSPATADVIASMARPASALESPVLAATASISSPLFMLLHPIYVFFIKSSEN
jgi:hypothetical protein